MENMFTHVMWYLEKYKRYVIGLLLCAAASFVALALCSFCPTDQSWFYYASDAHNVVNGGGIIGAHIAGLLFYLFGSASLMFVPLLFFIGYLLILNRRIKDHMERIVAGFVCMIIYAGLLYLYKVDLLGYWHAGGYMGRRLILLINRWFDPFCVKLFLYTMLFSSLILLLRFSFIGIVHYGLQMTKFLVSSRLWLPIHNMISMTLWITARPVVWFYSAVIGLSKIDALPGNRQDEKLLPCFLSEERFPSENNVQDEIPQTDFIEGLSDDNVDDNVSVYCDQKDEEHDLLIQDVQDDQDDMFVAQEAVSAQDEEHIDIVIEQEQEEPYILSKVTGYALPNLDIFIGNQEERDNADVLQHLQEQAQLLEQKLERFGVSGKVVSIKRGPVVTLFEYQPDIDSKISKITALEDDLALALQALSIRIIAPIPGKPFVGFEVSNRKRKDVLLADVLRSDVLERFEGYLPLALGQDTIGNNVIVDLARMPHLLIAGSTGSGKSVALNTMLVSLLCRLTPDELRLVLIDPKRLEFASYADIAHLLFPIVTHPKKAAPVLKWVVQQMEERYELMAQYGARNVQDFNVVMKKIGKETLPFIVVIIDELADLMMTAGREVEDLIARITQMARAAGIHLVVATQRPSVDVITGLIKVNFPSRISFRVTSKIDSRTILDCSGADKLLGRGDMLFLDSQDASLKRLHGAYVSDNEIDQLVLHIKNQREVQYLDFQAEVEQLEGDEDRDDIYEDVLEYLEEIDEISISLLQRKFRIGYNRSARIIDMLEAEGLIGSSGNGKTRSVIR
jgi:DNA segregation ATPase FtsK/SpoIIIE-like protein